MYRSPKAIGFVEERVTKLRSRIRAILFQTRSQAGGVSFPREGFVVAAIISVGAAVVFPRLGGSTLAAWDEAIYAEIAKEILRTGNWLSPEFAFEPFFEKPPLFPWTTALLFRMFGISEFWARASSALCSLGVLLVIYRIGTFSCSRAAGLTSVSILLVSHPFVGWARFGTTDMMLTLLLLMVIYAYLRADRSPRWWYVGGVCTGLAIMVKSAAGLLALLAVFVSMSLDRRRTYKSRPFWYSLAAAVAIALPWHAVTLYRFGSEFLAQYFGRQILTRVFSELEGGTGDRLYYLRTLRQEFGTWYYFLLPALALEARRILEERDRGRILLVFPLVGFGLYSAVATKLPWYVLPVFPVFALLTGFLIHTAFTKADSFSLSLLAVGTLVPILEAPIYIAIALGCVFAAMIVLSREWQRAAVVALWILLMTMSAADLVPLYTGRIDPLSQVAGSLRNTDASPDHIVVFRGHGKRGPDNWYPVIVYYSGRPTKVVNDESELTQATMRPEGTDVILPAEDIEQLSHHFKISLIARSGPFAAVRILTPMRE